MKIVFMGTPEISVPCLERLIKENYEIQLVVTQPDRPKGRGKKMAFSPVKEVAIKNELPLSQPHKVKDSEFIKKIKSLDPDIIVVIAFGQILPKEILEIPKYGCINVHVSLLPKYRGAAPINWVVINGESETGISTMYMDAGLDTGDIILQTKFELDNKITAGELHDKIMYMGADVLKETIDMIKDGIAPRTKQDDSKSSYAPIMDKKLGKIDFSKPANQIHNLIRGVNPWPSAYTLYKDKVMKIWKCRVLDELSTKSPGTILDVSNMGIKVSTGDNVLLIEEIQMPNKKRVMVSEYIKGNEIKIGVLLN